MVRSVLGVVAGVVVWMVGFFVLALVLAQLWPDYAVHGREWTRQNVFTFTSLMACCNLVFWVLAETGAGLAAGKIAKRFLDITRNMPPSAGREKLKASAERFATLVETRNQILHGKPCTGPNGESRLSSSKVLEIPDLENAADAFSQCSIELNEQFYGFLASYHPQ